MSRPLAISERYLELASGRVFVKQWSMGDAPAAPIVLLHDSLGCVALWREFPAALAAATGRSVVAYDRPGFGRSAARAALPSPRFISEEAEGTFAELRQELGLERCVLFGHSVGGAMSVACAARHASACEAVITEAAQAFVEQQTRQGIVRARELFSSAAGLDRLRIYHGDKAPWVLRAWTELWLSPQFAAWSLATELPQLHCPLLVLHGDADEYGSLAFPQMLCGLAGGAARQVILERCGHVPHREYPERVLEQVVQFLQPGAA